jgi:two-component system, OmpR family, phosphate regulon response regulator PhoB
MDIMQCIMGVRFRVLVVEDEPVIQELIASILEEFDCEVESASAGLEGLKIARTQAFDLILLDVVIPQLDGIAVCRMLKANVRTQSVPLYMLTAKTKKADIEVALKAGADGYILKPFKAIELIELVDTLRSAQA